MQKAISQIKNLSDNPYLFRDENGKNAKTHLFFQIQQAVAPELLGLPSPSFAQR